MTTDQLFDTTDYVDGFDHADTLPEIDAPEGVGSVEIRYANLLDQDFQTVTFATKEQQKRAVQAYYPDHQWDDSESALWNWVKAVADEHGIGYSEARQSVANAADFGPNRDVLGRWIWFLA